MMALFDEITQELKKYVSVERFLYYLSARSDESIRNVVAWLIFKKFDEQIQSYFVDEFARETACEKDNDIDILTNRFFYQIGIFDYTSYIKFLSDYQDFTDGLIKEKEFERSHLKGYEIVDKDFYYKIDDLKNLNILTRFNLNFDEINDFNYKVDYYDNVIMKKPLIMAGRAITHDSVTLQQIEATQSNPHDPIKEPLAYRLHEAIYIDNNDNNDMIEIDYETKQSYLVTIGLLVEMIQQKKYSSQTDIITSISERKIIGQGKTTLENRFKFANIAKQEQIKKSKP